MAESEQEPGCNRRGHPRVPAHRFGSRRHRATPILQPVCQFPTTPYPDAAGEGWSSSCGLPPIKMGIFPPRQGSPPPKKGGLTDFPLSRGAAESSVTPQKEMPRPSACQSGSRAATGRYRHDIPSQAIADECSNDPQTPICDPETAAFDVSQLIRERGASDCVARGCASSRGDPSLTRRAGESIPR